MKKSSPIFKIRIFLFLFMAYACTIIGQDVIRNFSNQELNLRDKLISSMNDASEKYGKRKIWVIYTILGNQNYKPPQKITNNSQRSAKTLNELIQYDYKDSGNSIRSKEMVRQIPQILNSVHPQKPNETDNAKSELAIILDCSLESGRPRIYNVFFQPLHHIFTEEERPVYWLGNVSCKESFTSLENLFQKSSNEKLKTQIVKVLGLHNSEQKYNDFAKSILKSDESISIKFETIHWLGFQNSIKSIKVLTNIAFRIREISIRKKAIQSLAQMNHKTANAALRILAQKDKTLDIRKEAMFWLSQVADSKSIQTLNKIVVYEKDTELKEYAVFAISQLPKNKGEPILAQIAKKSPNPKIREKAIFWLGQTSDEKEIEFLIDVFNGMEE